MAFAVRAYRIGAPDGGYHVFNEGFYLKMAAAEALRGPFEWLTAPLDLNNPPLYPLLLSVLFRVFGPGMALARGFTAVIGVLTVLYVYLLGKLLYNERIGLVAGAALAVMPGVALVTRNVQVDALMVLLCMAAIYHYARSARDHSDRQALLGGALLGLALSTKLPAVLMLGVLAIWETWRTPGLGWLKKRATWLFAGGFAALGLPWYLVQVLRPGSVYLASQTALASSAMGGPTLGQVVVEFGRELMWMVMPLALAVAVVALGYMLYKRAAADRLVLVGLAVTAAFYLAFKFHSYYLLPLAPFLALAIGRGVYSLGRRFPRATSVSAVALIAMMVLATATMLAGNKYGNWSPAAVAPAAGGLDERAVVYATQEILGAYQPAVEYELAPARVIWLADGFGAGDVEVPEGGRAYILTTLGFTDDSGAALTPMVEFTEDEWGVSVLGLRITQTPTNRHYFAAGDISVDRVGAPLFGFTQTPVGTGINLYDVSVLQQQADR
ncbi:MAG: ArnT family glycosyltransferase [Coriobacteriia bacterium]